MFLTLKTIHMCCALISFTGFLFRAYLMVIDSKLLNHKYILVTPHLIDTLFLLSGFSMAFVLNMGLFAQGWLSMKILLLMFYLLFVGIALNRGKTKSVRVVSFFLAVMTFLFIVGIAVNKTGISWFAMI
ncbi:MAG: SirB2 family protein [Gammaproteobacteria bacterium]|nr:SirB2 family protein [Gammaproteobacteria bacterium]